MSVPLSGEAVFTFTEGKNSAGTPLVSVAKYIPESWNPKTNVVTGRIGDIGQYPVPPIQGRAVTEYRPHLPLDVADGKDAIFWAVFVDEPPGTPPEDLEERARKADVGFIFRIRTAEETKE
jgi:hypothetical protein